MPGRLEVVIGPNGYGKTTYLENKRAELNNGGVDLSEMLYLQSEIKLLDEVKDSLDNSQTMEFLMADMIETPSYIAKREALFEEIDSAIAKNTPILNKILDEVLEMNGSTRKGDFIFSNSRKRTIKYPVAINQRDVKDKMGSGQRMQLLLQFAQHSKKQYIFLDEPEKYSHPSLLNRTASLINGLVARGKDVYLATHSPKLVSMLEIDYANIKVINDSTHLAKEIPFDEAVRDALKKVSPGMLEKRFVRYYKDGDSFKDCLMRRHGRFFIESLFSSHVYLCEGANDEVFVLESLRRFGGYYDDYSIVKTWGKSNLPVFIALYKLLGIPYSVLFDVDDELRSPHDQLNLAIRQMALGATIIEFAPRLEEAVGFSGPKHDALAMMDYLEDAGIDPKYDPR